MHAGGIVRRAPAHAAGTHRGRGPGRSRHGRGARFARRRLNRERGEAPRSQYQARRCRGHRCRRGRACRGAQDRRRREIGRGSGGARSRWRPSEELALRDAPGLRLRANLREQPHAGSGTGEGVRHRVLPPARSRNGPGQRRPVRRWSAVPVTGGRAAQLPRPRADHC